MVALEAHVAHAHVGKDIEERLHHPQSRPQDRHHDERLLRQHAAGMWLEGCLDRLVLQREVARGLDREQQPDLVSEGAERGRLRGLVAQVRDGMHREGMVEDVEHGGKGGARP